MSKDPHRAGRSWEREAINIDKLKSMNDTFGHQAGDELIRVVAGALRRAVRRGDVAALAALPCGRTFGPCRRPMVPAMMG